MKGLGKKSKAEAAIKRRKPGKSGRKEKG